MKKGDFLFLTGTFGKPNDLFADAWKVYTVSRLYPGKINCVRALPISGGKSILLHEGEFMAIYDGLVYQVDMGYEWTDVTYPRQGFNKDQIVNAFQRGIARFKKEKS